MHPSSLVATPVLALAPLLLGACSSASSPSSGAPFTAPPAAELVAFTHLYNILTVPVDVAGTTGLLFVDTGDPYVILSPTIFPQAPSPVGNVASLSVESDQLAQVQVVTSSQSAIGGGDPLVPLGGILGCSVICKSIVSFNYRDAIFTIGSSKPPSGLLPETKLSFSLKGGGMQSVGGATLVTPPSRIVVSVDIEGTKHTMVLDTGASYVTVDKSVFSAITKDGRKQIGGATLTTVSGASGATAARAKTVSLGGAQLKGVVVVHDPSFDMNLAKVSADAGETIEGSLGGNFLNHFYVTIDYPGGELHLAPYSDTSFIFDQGELLGFVLGPKNGSGYPVSKVLSGTDAASKGVQVGDSVVAIDGQKLGSLSLTEAEVLLGGPVGSTRMVQFGAAKKLSNSTVPLKVVELLPP